MQVATDSTSMKTCLAPNRSNENIPWDRIVVVGSDAETLEQNGNVGGPQFSEKGLDRKGLALPLVGEGV